ncbi:MAG: MBL fold metallo-hydrolase [Myxococcota bacterium]|nr:MBL fold metallo-hydrolase [Myxococcota bacterium]
MQRRDGEGERLSAQIYRLPLRSPTLPPATTTNCYLLGERTITVVDPAAVQASTRASLQKELEVRVAAGASIAGVFLTHHHRDHIGSAAWVAERYDCPIWAHRESAARLPELSITKIGEGGLMIDDHPWQLVETPGHAPGHLCLVSESQGEAIVGDMVAGVGTILIEPTDGDMALYLQSLKRLASMKIQRLHPAHGAALTPAEQVLRFYIAHRLKREEKVYAALPAEGSLISLKALVEVAYAEASPEARRGPRGGLAGLSAHAHLLKLQKEGRVEEREGLWARRGDGVA